MILVWSYTISTSVHHRSQTGHSRLFLHTSPMTIVTSRSLYHLTARMKLVIPYLQMSILRRISIGYLSLKLTNFARSATQYSFRVNLNKTANH